MTFLQKTSSLAATALISCFVYGLASPISAMGAPVVLERLEASVNASIILLSDVRTFRASSALRQQLDPLFAGAVVASRGEKASDTEIIEFLINEKLIEQQFPVSDAEVEQEINSIQANNKIDRASLKKALSEQGYSFAEYFELIRTSAAKRNLIDRDIRTKVSVSDDDVKNYFYNHYMRNSSMPMAYSLEVISVSPSNYKSPSAAKEVALRALREIKAGEPFQEVAKRVSDDPSAASGGDLGTLTEDQMSSVIREQAKKLQIGEISAVFGGPPGPYLIIKLIDVKSDDSARLSKMKEEIRNQLIASEYQHQIQLWLDRQRQTAFIHRAGEPTTAGIPVAP
jgi:peptidyl-prolyl cis-trans isomerase SurA